MENNLEKQNLTYVELGFFSARHFGIAWLTALVIFLTGGIANSPRIGGILSLALILMAVPYMCAPAIANILTRLLTREGWKDTGIRPHFQKGWPYLVDGLGASSADDDLRSLSVLCTLPWIF